MKKSMLAAVLFLTLVLSCTNANTPATPATLTPDINGFYTVTGAGLTFMWKITGGNMECKMSRSSTGWIAVGFDSAGKMNGQNIVIGYVTTPNTVTLSHEHGVGHDHDNNAVPDLTAISGTESGGTTEINWTMPLVPSDGYTLVQDATMYLTLSYGSSDNLTSQHPSFKVVHIILQ